MAGLREIQNRIRSIQDTRKITNAMYLISSTKLKKARKELAEKMCIRDRDEDLALRDRDI